jgi:hypothetical protein
MSFAIPKLEPDWVCLHEAAPRVVEREPSLDIGQVRQTLCDAIAYGRLHVQSDDDPMMLLLGLLSARGSAVSSATPLPKPGASGWRTARRLAGMLA